ncbi:MAG: hypothetical protein AB8G15_09835 [Saprospiraceae bacterium]
MNIWDHSRLSVRKFGGKEEDYFAIHKFLDSSKLFYFHVKHRLLLHHLFGIELTIEKFGDYLENSTGKIILVRDIAAEHLKEDLSGKVPSLYEWLSGQAIEWGEDLVLPEFENAALEKFVLRPYLKSKLKASLLLTFSDFGVYLAREILDIKAAQSLRAMIKPEQTVQHYLTQFKFTQRWQFHPDPKELAWLKDPNNFKK